MKKEGICKLKFVIYPYGSVYELEDKETEDYVLPDSVRLVVCNDRLRVTQFDGHGNPQIGGIAGLLLGWKIRQKVRDGLINSEHDVDVMYSYETLRNPLKIPFKKRLPPVDICPVCGELLTSLDLDGVENCDGMIVTTTEPPVKTIWRSVQNAVVHAKCSDEFCRLEMIDELAEYAGMAFNFKWGKEKFNIWHEPILDTEVPPSVYPSLLFHTPDGDMEIRKNKDGIDITFLPNFATFDMAIFIEDDIPRNFSGNGVRIIHVEDKEQMFKCLVKVYKTLCDKTSLLR